MRKFVAIEVGPRSSMELDVEGRWLVRWGVPITINGNVNFYGAYGSVKQMAKAMEAISGFSWNLRQLKEQ